MCLNQLENFAVTQNYGWQVFEERSSSIYPCFFGNDKPVPVGKWQRDLFRIFERWIYSGDSALMKYRKGYHIFLNEEDTWLYCSNLVGRCIRKVRFKKVLARGFQKFFTREGQIRWAKVVVCHKRFVEPE